MWSTWEYLLAAVAVVVGIVLFFTVLFGTVPFVRWTYRATKGRWGIRVIAGATATAVIWVGLFGLANARLADDRHYCSVGIWHVNPPNGPFVLLDSPEKRSACVKARESKRWGPYHLLGSNNGDD
jgi:hypothetical protein